MSFVIAVVGKGGVGKTTFSGMLVQHLCSQGKKPILAVDADANSNLNEVLGVNPQSSLGEIREELEQAGYQLRQDLTTKGLSDYVTARMDEAITKGDGFDLMVMGRSQGKGCYCYVNSLLSYQMLRIDKNYSYILVDNAAGMEHISRGTIPKVDVVVLVSDCSRRGIQAAGRINNLVLEYGFNPSLIGLVVNVVPNSGLDEGTAEEITNQGLNLIGIIPQDDEIFQMDCDGTPLVNLPETSPVKTALKNIFKKIGI